MIALGVLLQFCLGDENPIAILYDPDLSALDPVIKLTQAHTEDYSRFFTAVAQFDDCRFCDGMILARVAILAVIVAAGTPIGHWLGNHRLLLLSSSVHAHVLLSAATLRRLPVFQFRELHSIICSCGEAARSYLCVLP
jgi:hypothetical protein